MKTFLCTCGNSLFFENTQCLACGMPVGWCPGCRAIAPLLIEDDGSYRCGRAECGGRLVLCRNYSEHQVCNRCLPLESSAVQFLCDCCRYTRTIPDLSVEGNLLKWSRLETAKRRLFYNLDLLGLPYGTEADRFPVPLSFHFKADPPPEAYWQAMGNQEQVLTGHVRGAITINIREADDVQREQARVDFGESHRTLIGHFRHEIGHYYWEVLIAGRWEAEFAALFGDPRRVPYTEAMQSYYQNGPPADWRQRCVSAYASLHPWEDFAETFATYLDLVSVLDTAWHFDLMGGGYWGELSFDDRLLRYQRLGVAMNEINRSMGLTDLVPEIFVPPVVEKMRWVAERIATARSAPPAHAL